MDTRPDGKYEWERAIAVAVARNDVFMLVGIHDAYEDLKRINPTNISDPELDFIEGYDLYYNSRKEDDS